MNEFVNARLKRKKAIDKLKVHLEQEISDNTQIAEDLSVLQKEKLSLESNIIKLKKNLDIQNNYNSLKKQLFKKKLYGYLIWPLLISLIITVSGLVLGKMAIKEALILFSIYFFSCVCVSYNSNKKEFEEEKITIKEAIKEQVTEEEIKEQEITLEKNKNRIDSLEKDLAITSDNIVYLKMALNTLDAEVSLLFKIEDFIEDKNNQEIVDIDVNYGTMLKERYEEDIKRSRVKE